MPSLSREALILDPAAYAAVRRDRMARMIPLRRTRRVRLGDMLALEFENAETLQYQAQEMLFIEEVTDESEVAGELAAYARMLPSSHELSATMFIELDAMESVRTELARLQGIQRCFSLRVGGDTVPAYEQPGMDEEDGKPTATVSVHMLRFRFTDEQRDAFRDPSVPAAVVVEHPEYADEEPLEGDTRLALIADLALPPQ